MTTIDCYNDIINTLDNHFGNSMKTTLWLIATNPLLGDVKPIDMIFCGRGPKLLNFINTAIKEGKIENFSVAITKPL